MNQDVISRLIDLNHQFYQTFAGDFAATRQRLQPGIQRLLPRLEAAPRILDLGCGSGTLACRLVRRGYEGEYTGLDFSAGLLAIAAGQAAAAQGEGPGPGRFRFIEANLAGPHWADLPGQGGFTAGVAFAVLHHLPGEALRLDVLRQFHRLLASGAEVYLSAWQFMNSPRLAARIVPWDEAGLNSADVEPGDALLDWRAGGRGLRYAHQFTGWELERLAEASGFTPVEAFYSDGKEGRLALYQVWRKRANPAP